MQRPFLRPALLLLAAGLAVSATAQVIRGAEARDRAMNSPGFKMRAEASGRSGKLKERARQSLRTGGIASARRLAQEAVDVMDEVGEYDETAHEILAEIWLLQGEPGLALDQFPGPLATYGELQSDDAIATKSIALVRLGSLDAARAILVEALGDARSTGGKRLAYRIEGLPMHQDRSAAALEATALVYRAQPYTAMNTPGAIADLREAIRLAPRSALAGHLLARAQKDRGFVDEALATLLRIRPNANAKQAAKLDREIIGLQVAIRERDRKRAEPQTPPPSS